MACPDFTVLIAHSIDSMKAAFAIPRLSYSPGCCPELDELYSSNPQPADGNVDGMEYAKLETAALAHVDDSYYYGAYCRKCKHSARLSLVKLREHLGDNFPMVKVKDRLRCERCSSRQIVITFLAPNQRTGNLAYLFGEPPRQ
jgi:hypothetical protein